MKRIVLGVIAIGWFFVAKSQNGVTHEAVIWYQFSEKTSLSEKIDGSFTVQYRDFIDREKDYHVFLSAGLDYKLANGFSLGVGLTNLNINRVVESEYVLVPEIRPYQQVTYATKFDKVQFNWRFMIEERYFRRAENGELISGHDFNFRFRNLGKVTFLLSQKMDISMATEIHFNGGGRAAINVFDQHRSTIMTGYKAGKVKLSTGYMHWAVLNGADVFENRHTWMITASHSF